MKKEIEKITDLLKKAGDKILEIYEKDYQISEKEDKTPVTEADLISEKIILEGLKEYNYNILSEEKKDDLLRLTERKLWIVDPLDGTQDFLQKTGEFSIMIGLVSNKKPVLGAIYIPVKDKMYFAEKKKGAYFKKGNGPWQKLQVSDISDLSKSNLVISRSHLSLSEGEFIQKLDLGKINLLGSIGVKIGLIAEGKANLYFNTSNKTFQWDTCAPEIILEEAGGKITDLVGKDLLYNQRELRNLNGVIASNGMIHDEVISLYKVFDR